MVAFSYYGSKSKFVQYYPKPTHELIIEPFCGAANYALRYWRHEVELYDLNPLVIKAWRFLLREDALEWVRKLPVRPEVGTKTEDLLPVGAPPEMQSWLEGIMSRGTMGSHTQFTITPLAVEQWGRAVWGAELTIRQGRGWKVKRASYQQIENKEATWFIDPPYQGKAGEHYACSSADIDYKELADWCKSRKGQVIVCEMQGADWLPFRLFRTVDRLANRGINRKPYKEVIWYKEK